MYKTEVVINSPLGLCQSLVTKTHRAIIILILTLFQTTIWSQDNLWSDRESIISIYENLKKNDTKFSYTIVDSLNKISVSIYGTDSLEITYFFIPYSSGDYDNESLCDSVVIKLICGDCIEHHISRYINSKERKWLKISDSTYISSKWDSKFRPADKSPIIYTRPMMKIIHARNHSEIILYFEEVTKKHWKELKKKAVTKT